MTAAMQRAMTAREWGLLAILSLLWGGSFFFVGVAVKELPPLTLVALRVGLAAALLWAGAPLIGVAPPRSVKAAAALAVLGFGNNALPFTLIAWGQTHIPSGLASILNAATPLFSVLAAHVLTKEEKLSGLKLSGTIAGLAGVVWLLGPDLPTGDGANLWAELAVLAAALSYALSAIFGRRMGSLGLKPIDRISRAARAHHRPALVSPRAERSGHGLRSRHRRAFHRARLRRLFPHSRGRGGDQCAPRDPARPCYVGRSRGALSA